MEFCSNGCSNMQEFCLYAVPQNPGRWKSMRTRLLWILVREWVSLVCVRLHTLFHKMLAAWGSRFTLDASVSVYLLGEIWCRKVQVCEHTEEHEEFSALVYECYVAGSLYHLCLSSSVLETCTSKIHFSSALIRKVAHIFQDVVMWNRG